MKYPLVVLLTWNLQTDECSLHTVYISRLYSIKIACFGQCQIPFFVMQRGRLLESSQSTKFFEKKFKVLNSSKSIYRSLILGEFWTIFCTEICNFTVCWADTKDTKEMKVVAGWYQLRSYVRKRYRLFDCSVGYVVKLCIRLIVSIHEFSNVKFTVVWTFK